MENLQNNFSPLGTLAPSVTLSLAARAKELKKQGLDVYSMSVGEPDFDTPQAIKDAAIKALNEGKGKTYYGIATTVCALATAVLLDRPMKYAVSVPNENEEKALSMLCTIAGQGIVEAFPYK